MSSGRGIELPPQTPFERRRSLVKASGPNKHDQVTVLVSACIGDGINTMGQLLDEGERMGFNRGHVARIVNYETGLRWRCRSDDTYVNIDSG